VRQPVPFSSNMGYLSGTLKECILKRGAKEFSVPFEALDKRKSAIARRAKKKPLFQLLLRICYLILFL